MVWAQAQRRCSRPASLAWSRSHPPRRDPSSHPAPPPFLLRWRDRTERRQSSVWYRHPAGAKNRQPKHKRLPPHRTPQIRCASESATARRSGAVPGSRNQSLNPSPWRYPHSPRRERATQNSGQSSWRSRSRSSDPSVSGGALRITSGFPLPRLSASSGPLKPRTHDAPAGSSSATAISETTPAVAASGPDRGCSAVALSPCPNLLRPWPRPFNISPTE